MIAKFFVICRLPTKYSVKYSYHSKLFNVFLYMCFWRYGGLIWSLLTSFWAKEHAVVHIWLCLTQILPKMYIPNSKDVNHVAWVLKYTHMSKSWVRNKHIYWDVFCDRSETRQKPTNQANLTCKNIYREWHQTISSGSSVPQILVRNWHEAKVSAIKIRRKKTIFCENHICQMTYSPPTSPATSETDVRTGPEQTDTG
jgi:hypothetical protein